MVVHLQLERFDEVFLVDIDVCFPNANNASAKEASASVHELSALYKAGFRMYFRTVRANWAFIAFSQAIRAKYGG